VRKAADRPGTGAGTAVVVGAPIGSGLEEACGTVEAGQIADGVGIVGWEGTPAGKVQE